ncbi:2,3-bisphosphoglycerate-independent phosphoglycerate mutase [Candidatus Gottesmanbacteria bacterium]|nr:2,3-bisphosphoglycerate-independent phosphoglycerate mutase [Candidatus Gottesmanbacteria bacterium]
MSKPVVLIILDGWGLAPAGPGNAISQASVPNYNKFWISFPHARLTASGEPVGLPHGERGNSETGHLNLGAGRIVYQDLPRINMSIADGSFFKNQAFLSALEHVKKNNSNLHLMGLIGQGGVHSSNEHLFALLHLAAEEKVKNLFLHLFTDGRDSPPTSAPLYISQVEEKLKNVGLGKIATLSGRYFALDRDNRWQRTQKAYEAIVNGRGITVTSPQAAIETAYTKGKTDEFIEPTIVLGKNKKPVATVSNNDAIIFYNFRIDRPRQLTKAFVLPDLEKAIVTKPYFDPYAEKYYKKTYIEAPQVKKTFPRGKPLTNLFFVTMTEYERGLPVSVAFPPITVNLPLARVLSERNLRQLHITETEKERFVTYYFNGQREDPCPEEDWVIIPSPNVPTYDREPAMSAQEITQVVIERLETRVYDFILINFANPDMVGHTGVIPAGVTACEVVDSCLGKITNNVLALEGTCIITADHGNVEEMINPVTGGVDTEHSTNLVPFIIVNKEFQGDSRELPSGILADVGPTILKLFKIPKPGEFSGRSLI